MSVDELWHAAQEVRSRRNDRYLRDDAGKIRRTALGAAASRRRLLAGFLGCGECGGSYHALTGRPEWGCSWHRNRGSCTNNVRIPQAKLEAAVLKAVRGALDEEIAEHALTVAIEELRNRIAAAEPTTSGVQLPPTESPTTPAP